MTLSHSHSKKNQKNTLLKNPLYTLAALNKKLDYNY